MAPRVPRARAAVNGPTATTAAASDVLTPVGTMDLPTPLPTSDEPDDPYIREVRRCEEALSTKELLFVDTKSLMALSFLVGLCKAHTTDLRSYAKVVNTHKLTYRTFVGVQEVANDAPLDPLARRFKYFLGEVVREPRLASVLSLHHSKIMMTRLKRVSIDDLCVPILPLPLRYGHVPDSAVYLTIVAVAADVQKGESILHFAAKFGASRVELNRYLKSEYGHYGGIKDGKMFHLWHMPVPLGLLFDVEDRISYLLTQLGMRLHHLHLFFRANSLKYDTRPF